MKYSTLSCGRNPYIDCYGWSNKEKNYFFTKQFDTYEEAVKEAKKTASIQQKDVEVWAVKATVKFPEPAYEVVLEDDGKA